MDKTKSQNFIPPINIMRLESLKEDNVYTGDKPLGFILIPKCPRDSTVVHVKSRIHPSGFLAYFILLTGACNVEAH